MNTLLLNADAAPISVLPLSVISWEESIRYLVSDKATVLEWYEDWIVHSATWETRVPAVMMVKDYVKNKKHPRFSKYNVIIRDRFTCQYCETDVSTNTVTMDHVLPISKGGKTTWENIVAACGPCNSRKGNDLYMKPIRVPHRPSYYELANIRKTLPFDLKHPSWKDYLL